MINLDMRFDVNILRQLVGKTFVEYKCDPFDYTNSVTQIVGFVIGDGTYKITNIQENTDYYGDEESVSICKFTKTDEDDVRSAFNDIEMIKTPVNGTIDRIVLVNENQSITRNGTEQYNVWLTRGIIFFVNGREVSFEKDIVPFSEEIIINRGYNLLEKFSDEKDFLMYWDDDTIPKCQREIVEITGSHD